MPTEEAQLSFLDSNRRFVHPEGILRADAIFVPLEDGDRCEALRRMEKEVITVDLNPMSRTARMASVTIVDNLARAMPLLIEEISKLKGASEGELRRILSGYDHGKVLQDAEACIRKGLK
jgi:4-phosphopantoate--beta-alanine ligase